MADDDLKFRIDLDADEFKKELRDAADSVKTFGDPVNLSSLIVTLGQLPAAFNTIKSAVMSLKAPLDLVFEGERIRAINQQFEILSSNAGVAGDALKAGLERAAGGLVDTTDLLSVANKAIITMGSSAKQLPEIMELARKASVVTGQDLTTTFEAMAQAIGTGQTRALKQMGIIVDLDKAYESYARSIDVSVNALSDAEKRQALANAAIEKGNKALAGVDDSVIQATNSWTQLKVALQDLKETFILVFEKTIGPTVKKAIGYLASFTNWVKGNTEKLLGMEEAATRTTSAVDALQKAGNGGAGVTSGAPEADLTKRRESEAKFQKEISNIRLQALAERQKIGITELEYDDNLAKQKLQVQEQYEAKIKEIQISKDLTSKQRRQLISTLNQEEQVKMLAIDQEAIDKRAALEKQGFDLRMQLATTEEQANAVFFDQQFALFSEYNEKIRLTQETQVLNEGQKNARILLLQQQLQAAQITLDAQQEDVVLRSYENQVRAAKSAYDKIAAGAALASAKGTKSMMDFSSLGASAVNAFASNSGKAFELLGQGSISLGDALKMSVLGAIADIADAQGNYMLLSAFLNPALIVPGLALKVLAGALRGLAGSGASSIPQSGGGASTLPNAPGQAGNAGLFPSDSSLAAAPTPTQFQSPKKQVTIQVQGSYFETEQTRTRLVDLIREAGDITDFKAIFVGST